MLHDERELVAAALALGARDVRGWSAAEEDLAATSSWIDPAYVATLRHRIVAGDDPLGNALCEIRSPAARRIAGATYTPSPIVLFMSRWAKRRKNASRVIDPGVGSGRFLLEAARQFPDCDLLGVEVDPLAAMLARAGLATSGLGARSEIALANFCDFSVPTIDGPTLYIGNPPYVRHHGIEGSRKEWLKRIGASLGLKASALAGLHVYFYLATARSARPGDFGAYITSSEWLDVNYGSALRELFLGRLGGEGIAILSPEIEAFEGTATTATVVTFEIGAQPRRVHVNKVRSLSGPAALDAGRALERARLVRESRWTRLASPRIEKPEGHVQLGELCRVHRGQVTGANRVWIVEDGATELPESVLYPAITRARELIDAEPILSHVSHLRRVIDLPEDLDEFEPHALRAIESLLADARRCGADRGYVASHRRVWWRVGLRSPAPILATYMARRPPAFVRNAAAARHINIAHGIYPREPMTDSMIEWLVKALAVHSSTRDGRTYSGGLTKFEPKEMERLYVPEPHWLEGAAAENSSAPGLHHVRGNHPG